jgi:predicted transcriptional regulator
MATLAAYPGMMQRDRRREGLRVCRAAWLLGVTVREYRELEAGQRSPTFETWNRICELYGWPQTFVGYRSAP